MGRQPAGVLSNDGAASASFASTPPTSRGMIQSAQLQLQSAHIAMSVAAQMGEAVPQAAAAAVHTGLEEVAALTLQQQQVAMQQAVQQALQQQQHQQQQALLHGYPEGCMQVRPVSITDTGNSSAATFHLVGSSVASSPLTTGGGAPPVAASPVGVHGAVVGTTVSGGGGGRSSSGGSAHHPGPKAKLQLILPPDEADMPSMSSTTHAQPSPCSGLHASSCSLHVSAQSLVSPSSQPWTPASRASDTFVGTLSPVPAARAAPLSAMAPWATSPAGMGASQMGAAPAVPAPAPEHGSARDDAEATALGFFRPTMARVSLCFLWFRSCVVLCVFCSTS